MMKQRTLSILIVLGMFGIGFVILLQVAQQFADAKPKADYISLGDVRGSTVVYQGKPFTLNFDQQSALVGHLNRSIPISRLPPEGFREKPPIDQIIIHPFVGEDIILTPIWLAGPDYIFSVPAWQKEGYLMDVSAGSIVSLVAASFE